MQLDLRVSRSFYNSHSSKKLQKRQFPPVLRFPNLFQYFSGLVGLLKQSGLALCLLRASKCSAYVVATYCDISFQRVLCGVEIIVWYKRVTLILLLPAPNVGFWVFLGLVECACYSVTFWGNHPFFHSFLFLMFKVFNILSRNYNILETHCCE